MLHDLIDTKAHSTKRRAEYAVAIDPALPAEEAAKIALCVAAEKKAKKKAEREERRRERKIRPEPTPWDHDDRTPGILSFAREPKPEVEKFDEDPFWFVGMGDLQVKPDRQDEEAQRIRANAQKGCAGCPGHCCIAFVLRFDREEQEKRAVELKKEVEERLEAEYHHSVLMQFHDGGRHQKPGYTKTGQDFLGWRQSDLYTIEFFRDRLIAIEDAPAGHKKDVWRCAAFDLKTRRCTQYQNRPQLCRSYICGPASVGQTPPAKSMMSGHCPSVMKIIQKMPVAEHLKQPAR